MSASIHTIRTTLSRDTDIILSKLLATEAALETARGRRRNTLAVHLARMEEQARDLLEQEARLEEFEEGEGLF